VLVGHGGDLALVVQARIGGGVLQVDDRPVAVRVVLGVLGREGGQHGRIVGAAVVVLDHRGQAHELLEVEDHRRQVLGRFRPRVEVLVHRPVGDLERAARVPVEALAVDDAEALARQDVDRLLAVGMPAGVPADGDLALEHVAAHGRVAQLVGDHQLDPGVLAGPNPWDVPVTGDEHCPPHLLVDLVPGRQPLVVERAHGSPRRSPGCVRGMGRPGRGQPGREQPGRRSSGGVDRALAVAGRA